MGPSLAQRRVNILHVDQPKQKESCAELEVTKMQISTLQTSLKIRCSGIKLCARSDLKT